MNDTKMNLNVENVAAGNDKQTITIRPIAPKDEVVWKEMWKEYNNFYGADISVDITESLWLRILDKDSSIGALIAEDNIGVIGFANYVLHEYTWSVKFACLMDDLFVIPSARGKGAATLIIEKLIEKAKENGWTRLYWMTREGNAAARSLYDKFCKSDGFVRYTIPLDGIRPLGGNSK